MKGLFITGTDTEVGKTVITAAIAAGLRARGNNPKAVKPLATGSGGPGEDATAIAKAAGHAPAVFACFPEPASPERAARQANIELDDDGFLNWMRAQQGDPLLVEGVGGWAVPLTASLTVEDLAMALNLPVIIVSANRLGMLNHTLLTAEAVRESGLPLAGVVVNNGTEASSPLQAWNIEDLRRWLGPQTPLTVVDRITEADQAAAGEHILTTLNL
jgi:dethiobiotin synthetase